MAETVTLSDLTNLEARLHAHIDARLDDHAEEDSRRFAELNASVYRVDGKAQQLIVAAAENMGAAKAIADLAAQRAKEQSDENARRAWLQSQADARRGRIQTWIMSGIGVALTLITILIQKHIL